MSQSTPRTACVPMLQKIHLAVSICTLLVLLTSIVAAIVVASKAIEEAQVLIRNFEEQANEVKAQVQSLLASISAIVEEKGDFAASPPVVPPVPLWP